DAYVAPPPVAEQPEVPERHRLRGDGDREGVPQPDGVGRPGGEVEAEEIGEDERRRHRAELDRGLEGTRQRDGQLPGAVHAALRACLQVREGEIWIASLDPRAAGTSVRPIAARPSTAQRYFRWAMSNAAPCTTRARRPAATVRTRSAPGWRAARSSRQVHQATQRWMPSTVRSSAGPGTP